VRTAPAKPTWRILSPSNGRTATSTRWPTPIPRPWPTPARVTCWPLSLTVWPWSLSAATPSLKLTPPCWTAAMTNMTATAWSTAPTARMSLTRPTPTTTATPTLIWATPTGTAGSGWKTTRMYRTATTLTPTPTIAGATSVRVRTAATTLRFTATVCPMTRSSRCGSMSMMTISSLSWTAAIGCWIRILTTAKHTTSISTRTTTASRCSCMTTRATTARPVRSASTWDWTAPSGTRSSRSCRPAMRSTRPPWPTN
jgi:hypothetical protein